MGSLTFCGPKHITQPRPKPLVGACNPVSRLGMSTIANSNKLYSTFILVMEKRRPESVGCPSLHYLSGPTIKPKWKRLQRHLEVARGDLGREPESSSFESPGQNGMQDGNVYEKRKEKKAS